MLKEFRDFLLRGNLVTLAVAFVMIAVYSIPVSPRLLSLPLFLGLIVVAASGTSFWLSALSVRYRDVRHVVPFAVQLWLFATPVAYPASLVPQTWRALYGLNPMASVIEGFRWALVGGPSPGTMTLFSAVTVLVALVSGLMYFKRAERTFADIM